MACSGMKLSAAAADMAGERHAGRCCCRAFCDGGRGSRLYRTSVGGWAWIVGLAPGLGLGYGLASGWGCGQVASSGCRLTPGLGGG